MNRYIISIVFSLALISTGNVINAYSYKTNNNSGKDLIIQVERQTDTSPYFQRVEKGKQGVFNDSSSSGGLCLNNIKCIIYDDAFKKVLKDNGLEYPDDVKGAAAFANEMRGKLLRFLEKNEQYRKTAIFKKPDGSRYDGGFCSSRVFTITFENGQFYATYSNDPYQ